MKYYTNFMNLSIFAKGGRGDFVAASEWRCAPQLASENLKLGWVGAASCRDGIVAGSHSHKSDASSVKSVSPVVEIVLSSSSLTTDYTDATDRHY